MVLTLALVACLHHLRLFLLRSDDRILELEKGPLEGVHGQ
jgi:hypothetical protein